MIASRIIADYKDSCAFEGDRADIRFEYFAVNANANTMNCLITRYIESETTTGKTKKKKRTSTLRNSTTSTSSSHSSIERDLFGEAPVVVKKVFVDGVPQWLHAIYKRAKIAPFADIYAQPFNLSPAEAHKLELLQQQQQSQSGDPLPGGKEGENETEVDPSTSLPIVQQRGVTFEDNHTEDGDDAVKDQGRDEDTVNEFQGGMCVVVS